MKSVQNQKASDDESRNAEAMKPGIKTRDNHADCRDDGNDESCLKRSRRIADEGGRLKQGKHGTSIFVI